jgi:hypothetical protein
MIHRYLHPPKSFRYHPGLYHGQMCIYKVTKIHFYPWSAVASAEEMEEMNTGRKLAFFKLIAVKSELDS